MGGGSWTRLEPFVRAVSGAVAGFVDEEISRAQRSSEYLSTRRGLRWPGTTCAGTGASLRNGSS